MSSPDYTLRRQSPDLPPGLPWESIGVLTEDLEVDGEADVTLKTWNPHTGEFDNDASITAKHLWAVAGAPNQETIVSGSLVWAFKKWGQWWVVSAACE